MSADDELREAERAAVFAPDNAHAVARGLGYVRERDLWKVRGFESWAEYVEGTMKVPVMWVDLIVDAGREWRRGQRGDALPEVPEELVEGLESLRTEDD